MSALAAAGVSVATVQTTLGRRPENAAPRGADDVDAGRPPAAPPPAAAVTDTSVWE